LQLIVGLIIKAINRGRNYKARIGDEKRGKIRKG
jgi:hypothetical protein